MPLRALLPLVVALLAGAAPAAALTPESRPQAGGWTLVGGVSNETSADHVAALARHGDTLYLGGDFTGLARSAPGLAALDPATGSLVAAANDLDRNPLAGTLTVSAVVGAADGGIYVAGVFDGAGGIPQPRLLRLGADGALDAAFAPDVGFGSLGSTGAITSMALGADGSRLYLAGDFAKVGGLSRTQLAAVDARTGAVTGWQPSISGGSVTRVALGGGALYVSGSFTTVGGAARKGLAAVSLSNGAPTGFDPQPNAVGTVNDLAIAGSAVYIAGSFTTLQGASHPLVAAVDPATGAPTAFDAHLSGFRVSRIAIAGDTVYLGGASFTVGGGPLVYYGAVDRVTGAPVAWSPTLRKEPAALAADGDRVYVAFSGSPSPADGRCGLESLAAAGTPDAGRITDWDPHLGVTNQTADVCGGFTMSSLALAGGRVWAGGSFDAANVAMREAAAAIDLTTDRLTAWRPEVLAASGKAIVNALAVSPGGSTVYLGGAFSSVGGQARGNLAAVSAAGAGAPVAGWGNAANGTVRTLAVNPQGNRVYVGGSFTALGQFGRLGIGSVSATTGGVSANWKPQATSATGAAATVREIAVGADGRVFAAGSFARVGFPAAVDRAGLAAIVGEASTADTGVAAAWDPGLPAGTTWRSVALGDGRVYAGGTNLYAFDEASGARDTAFAAQPNGEVLRVSVDHGATSDAVDDTIYLAGAFTRLTGPDGVAQVRRSAGSVASDGTPTAWDPQPGVGTADPVPAGLLPLGDRLVFGGSFAALQGGALQRPGLAWFGAARTPSTGTAPTIAGTPALGSDLRCDPGRFGGSPGTTSWAWQRDGATIDGAQGNAYTIRSIDLGRALSCTQTVANTAGHAAATSAEVAVAAPAPELDTSPSVAGQPWPGSVATCTTGLWRNSPATFAYRWLLDGTPLDGEDDSAHPVSAAEQGHLLSCEVTASSAAGAATARSAPVTVTQPPPVNLGVPRVSGDAIVGATLSCDAGAWDGARSLSYIWLRDDAVVDGRTAASYAVTSKDLGHAIACVVGARNAGGERTAASAPVTIRPSAHTEGFSNRTPIAEVGGAVSGSSITKLDVRDSTLAKTGRRLVVRLAVPAAGKVTVSLKRGKTTYGRATVRVKKRSTVTVRIALSAKTAKAIRAKGAAGITTTLAATLKPLKGRTQSDRATVRLRLTTTTEIG